MKKTTPRNRLLVVSNDFTVRESLGGMLAAADYTVLFAENGRDAVETLLANPVRAILLDYKTPFEPSGGAVRCSQTLVALTDIDPFLPLLLTCEPEVTLDHRTKLMADLVLRHPVAPSALRDGIAMLLAETLRDRVYRKSDYIATLR